MPSDLPKLETPEQRTARLRSASSEELLVELDLQMRADRVFVESFGSAGNTEARNTLLLVAAARCADDIARLRPHARGESTTLGNALAYALGKHDAEKLRSVMREVARALRAVGA